MSKGLGLGRGLDALMAESEKEQEVVASVEAAQATHTALPVGIETGENGSLWVNPALLKPNPHQPRHEFSQEALQELADSIRENGIVQPVTIEDAGDGTFYIIAGERRTRAARIVGLNKIPIQLVRYSEEKKLEVALIENIQRSDLNPIEEASAYYKLMEMGGLNQDEVAKKVGKNRSTVANALRLLKLPQDIQTALSNGQISAGHARALLSVINPADQRVLFGRIVGNGLSVREAEQLASDYNSGGRAAEKKVPKPAPEKKDPDLVAIEQKFIEVFGTKVVIKGTLDKGTLQIDYYNRSDLDRLYEIINHS
ncbi:MAG: ParB/RepB/Spo0J family partition protein [Treponema sp.]|nr:ParB/RepB/Spo0J family partition protein [Treponema sp.]